MHSYDVSLHLQEHNISNRYWCSLTMPVDLGLFPKKLLTILVANQKILHLIQFSFSLYERSTIPLKTFVLNSVVINDGGDNIKYFTAVKIIKTTCC